MKRDDIYTADCKRWYHGEEIRGSERWERRGMTEHADFIADQKLPGMIVIHAVEDYDTWRAAYDDFDDIRKQHGIVGHAVNQELGKPNQVIVYHQANDMASLRAFLDSTELKEGMERAGVAEPPDIRFVEVSDFAEY